MTKAARKSSRSRMASRRRQRQKQSPNVARFEIQDAAGQTHKVEEPNRAQRKLAFMLQRTAAGHVNRIEQKNARKRKLARARRVLRKIRKEIRRIARRKAAA